MKTMFYCTNCVTPNTRPALEFGENGVCNACQWAEKKKQIEWNQRAADFKDFVAEVLAEANPKRHYDCVMTVSGGKDSTFQAWYAKNVLKINPLCVRIQPLVPTEIGQQNLQNIARSVGADTLSLVNNPKVFGKLAKQAFIEYGNPYVPYYYNIYSQTAKIALEKNIPMVIIGENGEQEYGGPSHRDYYVLDNKGLHERIGRGRKNYLKPHEWTAWGVEECDLYPYTDPDDDALRQARIRRFFMSDFVPWNNNEHLHYALNIIGGYRNIEKRTCGAYTHGFGIDDALDHLYLWIMWPKFGIQRANKYASTDIREGKLLRPGAIELVRLYDGEFPWDTFDSVLEAMDMEESQFWDIIRANVGDEENLRKIAARTGQAPETMTPAWIKTGPDRWRHANPVHGEERTLELPVPRPQAQSPARAFASLRVA